MRLTEICEWQTEIKKLIEQMTSKGQNISNKIYRNLQTKTGAALQPIFNSFISKYNSTIDQILQSEDEIENFQELTNLIGVGNSTQTTNYLMDFCKSKNETIFILSLFCEPNQQLFQDIFLDFTHNFTSTNPNILSIVKLLDYDLFVEVSIVETENIYNLFYSFFE